MCSNPNLFPANDNHSNKNSYVISTLFGGMTTVLKQTRKTIPNVQKPVMNAV